MFVKFKRNKKTIRYERDRTNHYDGIKVEDAEKNRN